MKKILVVIFCVIAVSFVYADSFDDFKNQNTRGFESQKEEFSGYKRETDKAFETYKKILEEEFENYKADILKNWDTAEVSGSKVWVEYLNNYKIRKKVDFENGDITIDIIEGQNSNIKPILIDLLQEDRGNAFRRDPVAFNTEQKLKTSYPDMLTAKIEDEPIVSDLFSEDRLTDTEADKLADKLIEKQDTQLTDTVQGGKPVKTITIKLPEDRYEKSARKVKPFVEKYSARFSLEPSLVFSVIYNESRFNPMAKSYIPAYGLMQIVPKSAGVDAIHFLEGEKRVLAPSYLYNEENNVKIGTAYLHIVMNRYFKGVENSRSRLYCAIAAYNTGAGNVAYAFNKNNGGRYSLSRAVPVINSMSPEQVYSYLKNNLRYEEARNYIVKVSEKMKEY